VMPVMPVMLVMLLNRVRGLVISAPSVQSVDR